MARPGSGQHIADPGDPTKIGVDLCSGWRDADGFEPEPVN
jgi:hypothetical protein